MSNEVGQIIRDHRKRLGLTLQELQKRTGINNGNLSKIERGQQSLTNDSMKAIAKAFGMSLPDLFSAQRAQPGVLGKNGGADSPRAATAHRQAGAFDNIDQIPQDENVAIGTISASTDAVRGGVKIQINEKVSYLFLGSELQSISSTPAALGAYVIEDDMMDPRLFKGDTVLVDTTDTTVPVTGGVFCVVLDDENIVFRRLMPYPNKGLRIMCDNQKYPEIVLDRNQALAITIGGRVKMVRSSSGL